MYTIKVPTLGPNYRIVMGTRNDGYVLVPTDHQPPKLVWVDPENCELGDRYMDPNQQLWWNGLTRQVSE